MPHECIMFSRGLLNCCQRDKFPNVLIFRDKIYIAMLADWLVDVSWYINPFGLFNTKFCLYIYIYM